MIEVVSNVYSYPILIIESRNKTGTEYMLLDPYSMTTKNTPVKDVVDIKPLTRVNYMLSE